VYYRVVIQGSQIPEPLQEILKRQQQQKVASGGIAPATVAVQHIKVTKPSVSAITNSYTASMYYVCVWMWLHICCSFDKVPNNNNNNNNRLTAFVPGQPG